MEEELELMYVDVMNDLVTLCGSYDDPEKFLELKAKCSRKIQAIKEYKIKTMEANKAIEEIKKLFKSNVEYVREFNKKYNNK